MNDATPDAAAPQVRFYDATSEPFVLASTDRFSHWKPLPWRFVTVGAAMDLEAAHRRTSLDEYAETVPAPNYWTNSEIGRALLSIPHGSRCSVNAEFWHGKQDWTLQSFGCMMARLTDARPDIDWALFGAHPREHRKVFEHVERDIGWISVNVFPGKYMEERLSRLSWLMNGMRKGDITRREVIVCVGHRAQGMSMSDELIEDRLRRDILPSLKMIGVSNVGVWEKNGRRDKIGLLGEIVEDVLGGAVPSDGQPDADAAGGQDA